MKCAIFEEHSSSCVVYFRFTGTLFPVSMIDGGLRVQRTKRHLTLHGLFRVYCYFRYKFFRVLTKIAFDRHFGIGNATVNIKLVWFYHLILKRKFQVRIVYMHRLCYSSFKLATVNCIWAHLFVIVNSLK